MSQLKPITYLLRLDDACPSMYKENWDKIEVILDEYNIKPMVGIIPNNKDTTLDYISSDENFLQKIKNWQNKGWDLALHGYNHIHCSHCGGINPIHKRSEFAGLPLKIQQEKICKGVRYFNDHNINVNYFFAPSHTFDLNTIEAIKSESNIRIISDTIAFNPYKKHGIIFIPQQFGRFRIITIPGTWTFCYHPNVMNENAIAQFSGFIEKYKQRFVSFHELDLSKTKDISLKDEFYQKAYFLFRKLKYR